MVFFTIISNKNFNVILSAAKDLLRFAKSTSLPLDSHPKQQAVRGPRLRRWTAKAVDEV